MNWDIKGCNGKCIKCSKSFNDNELFYCRLFVEKEGPRREDYCTDCWAGRTESAASHSSWQGKYKLEPLKIEEEPIEEPLLKHLLKKWIHSTERLHQCFCYVLVILLERNRTFSEKPSIKEQDGRVQLVYEDKDTGETYVIEDPHLNLTELNNIESQLQTMLKQELGSPQ